MKVILSRKGCDSDFGGVPGVILPDDRIVYIPIPGDEFEEISYGDVNVGGGMGKISDIIRQVGPNMRFNGERFQIMDDSKCHLDPDLNYFAYPRKDGWRGCFGQADAAQTVLRKADIKEGDLFLFFGWFNRTLEKEGKLCYCRGQGIHMIFGWLQIEEIIYSSRQAVPEWLKYHPHAIERRLCRPSNCIYVGREYLSWNSNIKGYGVFPKAVENLILTKEGKSRSKWKLPRKFEGINITYHSANSWKEDYFQSACRGQEFVFEEKAIVEDWAKNMISENQWIDSQ